jgi:hypothetical protein
VKTPTPDAATILLVDAEASLAMPTREAVG